MKDRVPLYPGRVKLVPVSGQENVYDMTRADQPTQDGDPINKATLLQDATAALFGLGTDAVPDDVLAWVGKYAQHWWRRRTPTKESYKTSEETPSENYVAVGYNTKLSVSYASTYNLNQNTGEISLVNPTTETFQTSSQTTSARNIINTKLYGKYFTTSKSDEVHKITKKLVNTDITLDSDWYVLSGRGLTLKVTKTQVQAGDWEYVQSSDRSAYPDSGEQDGYEYQYLGIPFENAASPHVKIATGSYVGTGKYGSSNPNSLTLQAKPKKVSIVGAYINSASSPGYGQHYNEAAFYCDVITSEYTSAGYGYLNYGGYQDIGGSDYKSKLVGNTLSWYNTSSAKYQFNESGVKYYYFAIL